MPPDDKRADYAHLVTQRKACRACPELVNPAAVDGGALDSDRIGPYTRWQGNLDAELLVVGQDFAHVDRFKDVKGWPDEDAGTNQMLVDLAGRAGVHIAAPRRGRSDDRLFFTNAVLCLKRDKGDEIPCCCYQACGRLFLRRTIELVAPGAVATLGLGALNATLEAFGHPRYRGALFRLLDSGRTYDLPFAGRPGGARLFPMSHPSPLHRKSRRDEPKQQADWQRLGHYLATARAAA